MASKSRTVKSISKSMPVTTMNNKKKKRRCRPGTVALREIRKYQKNTKLAIK